MAYGERRLRHGRMPGEYRLGDFSGLGLAGAIGILSASLLDLVQRGASSALFSFNMWVARITDLLGLAPVPLFVVVLLLMVVGALSIFYFQPVTVQGAFVQGFSLLAGLMTVAPSSHGTPMTEQLVGGPLPQISRIASPQPFGALLPAGLVAHKSASLSAGHVAIAQSGAASAKAQNVYDVTMNIKLQNGLNKPIAEMLRTGAIRGRLYISETRRSYDLFRNSLASVQYRDNVLRIRGIVPGLPDKTRCFVRFEIDGYRIEIYENEFEANEKYTWDITMTPSRTPLLIQRLSNSYWF